MSIGAAGAGASASLKQLMAERFLAEQEAARVQQAQAELELRRQQEARMLKGDEADEAYRTGQVARQSRLDTAGAARQAAQDEIAATELRRVGNERGVMQLMGQGLQQIDGATKPTRQQIIGMLTEIGKPPLEDLLRDPEQEFTDFSKRAGVEQENALARIRATGEQARQTQAARPQAPEDPNISKYALDTARRTIASIDDVLPEINAGTAGVFGSAISGIYQPSANVSAKLSSVASNIAFNALQAMRDASKTGGALGQVSERELDLLSAVEGSIRQNQSPANLKAQLQKVKESMARVQAAAMAQGNGGGMGSADDDALLNELLGGQ